MTTRPDSPGSRTSCTDSDSLFRRELRRIALPVTLQFLLQSSFSVIDQIMIGQLGTVSVAAIGIAANFIGLYNTLVSSTAGAASIILAQSIGARNPQQSGKAFYSSLAIMTVVSFAFAAVCGIAPAAIMGLYSSDPATVGAAAQYIRIYALGFIPQVVENIIAVYLRCTDAAKVPLYAGIGAAVTNTGLNLVLIFGTPLTPALGIRGAAWASTASQFVACLAVLAYFLRARHAGRMPDAGAHPEWELRPGVYRDRQGLRTFAAVLTPMVAGDFLWQLGNNVYASVYGHVGTMAMAAMTLINPLTTLVFGALAGLAQAALLMVGRRLGEGDADGAYATGRRLLRDGFLASLAIGVIVVLLRGPYVSIFDVDPEVRDTTRGILIVFAVLFPLRVVNMIMSSGILRSGGKTNYIMAISLLGTWCVGVPLGLLSAFALHWPIVAVYAMVSQEEAAKFLISLPLFRSRRWMHRLASGQGADSMQ